MAQKYINIEKQEHGLHLTLTKEGKAHVQEAIDDEKNIESDDFFRELLEYNLCNNSWQFIAPEDIGALTSAPILSDDTVRDNHGKIKTLGTVYWHERYQVESPIAEMLESGGVNFQKYED